MLQATGSNLAQEKGHLVVVALTSLNALVQRFSKYSDEAAIASHDELST